MNSEKAGYAMSALVALVFLIATIVRLFKGLSGAKLIVNLLTMAIMIVILVWTQFKIWRK